MAKHNKKIINNISRFLFKYKSKNTLKFHSCVKALFESASRALLPGSNGNRTSGSTETNIVLLILDGSLEKAFTALTRKDSVVEARNLVSTDRTRAVDELLAGDTSLRSQGSCVLGQVRWIQTLFFS